MNLGLKNESQSPRPCQLTVAFQRRCRPLRPVVLWEQQHWKPHSRTFNTRSILFLPSQHVRVDLLENGFLYLPPRFTLLSARLWDTSRLEG